MTEEVRLSRRVIVELGGALRGMATNATSMEEAAGRMVRHVYDRLRDPQTQQPLCALVRLFKTHRYQYLPHSLQVFAQHMAGGQPIVADTRCLTLLATAGDVPAWNSRQTSAGHQAIPLTSEEMVKQSPMIAQLLHQFGLDPHDVISPETGSMQHTRTDTYGIFHVAHAAESDYVPAQDAFVRPYGIASVLGFGGPLTAGNLFAMILFCKAPLSMETASEFPSVALSAKLALLSLTEAPIFAREDR